MKVTLLTVGFAVLLAGCAELLPPPDTRLAQQAQISNRVNAAVDKWACENGYNHVSHEVPARPPSPTGYAYYPSQGSFASNRDGDSPITADVCAKYGLDQQWLAIRAKRAEAKAQKEAAIADDQRLEAAQQAATEAQQRRIEAQQENEEEAYMKEEEAREKEEQWK